jgi:hypothetical protein
MLETCKSVNERSQIPRWNPRRFRRSRRWKRAARAAGAVSVLHSTQMATSLVFRGTYVWVWTGSGSVTSFAGYSFLTARSERRQRQGPAASSAWRNPPALLDACLTRHPRTLLRKLETDMKPTLSTNAGIYSSSPKGNDITCKMAYVCKLWIGNRVERSRKIIILTFLAAS